MEVSVQAQSSDCLQILMKSERSGLIQHRLEWNSRKIAAVAIAVAKDWLYVGVSRMSLDETVSTYRSRG